MHRSSGRPLFAAGDVVSGRYRIERNLGQDDDTDRYAAVEIGTARRWALKTPSRERLGSEKPLARFHRERSLSQRVSHPNVLQVEDVLEVEVEDVEKPVPCMVMELVEGESLASRLAESGAIDPEVSLTIACQLADALAAAHSAGVVHRDLKPQSVFLSQSKDGSMRAVLTDFGVARGMDDEPTADSVDSLTATNVVLGTPYYMAPEQLEAEVATPVTDIYALGLMLFEMVTGRLPFMAPTTLQAVFKRVQEDPPSPRRYLPTLSDAWEQTILRCLAREPEERFQSAARVGESLRGEGVGASPSPSWRSFDDQLLLRCLLGVFVLIAVIVVFILFI